MNKFNWTYLDDTGKRHYIGLMHGAQSGNLLVYCNTNIVLIDFHVFDTANYTFFIDEELCEVAIERKGNQFYYGFKTDKEVDTPLNRARKKIEKKHLLQSLAFLGSILVMVGLFMGGMNYLTNQSSETAFKEHKSKETNAQVFISPKEGGQKLGYFFVVNGQSYSNESIIKTDLPLVAKNGMPLEVGDEFVVKYYPSNPNINKIYYNRPTPDQLNMYRERAINKHQELNPDLSVNYCSCLADVAYKVKGLDGFTDFYFQEASIEQNPKHNMNTYKRLIRDLPFKEQADKNCWHLK